MKAAIASLLLLATVVSCGTLYGEKDDVIQEVKAKFEELSKFVEKVAADIKTEQGKTDSNGVTAATREGETRKSEAQKQLEKEVIDATKTAIAKGKPLNVIECIAKTSLEGNKTIEETLKGHISAVEAVKTNKDAFLVIAKLQNDLIKNATEGLKQQVLAVIEKADKGFQALKADALKKVASAENQLHELERRVPKPSLSEEYAVLRKRIGDKYKEIRDSLSKRLLKCLL